MQRDQLFQSVRDALLKSTGIRINADLFKVRHAVVVLTADRPWATRV